MLSCASLAFLTGGASVADNVDEHPLLAGPPYALDHLRNHCVDIPELTIGPEEGGAWVAACSVTSLEQFASFEGLDYYRAHYCLSPHWLMEEADRGCGTYPAAAHAIFVGRPGSASVSLFTSQYGDLTTYYDEPAIVSTRFGHVLHVSVVVSGTGYFNASDYYRWTGTDWRRIESEGWMESLQSFLDDSSADVPAGLGMRKGIWPDLSTLTARTPLYFQDDCNACASGGFLEATLAIDGDSFVVESIRYLAPVDEQD